MLLARVNYPTGRKPITDSESAPESNIHEHSHPKCVRCGSTGCDCGVTGAQSYGDPCEGCGTGSAEKADASPNKAAAPYNTHAEWGKKPHAVRAVFRIWIIRSARHSFVGYSLPSSYHQAGSDACRVHSSG